VTIEAVHIVLGLIDGRIGSVERDCVVIVALIVLKVGNEGEFPCRKLILREALVPVVVLVWRFEKFLLGR
jgi:hypothetical protein